MQGSGLCSQRGVAIVSIVKPEMLSGDGEKVGLLVYSIERRGGGQASHNHTSGAVRDS